MARGRSFPRKSGAVHNKEWTVSCLEVTALDLAIGALIGFVPFVADDAETVLRTHGFCSVELGADNNNERVTLAVGIGIISARAAAAASAVGFPRLSTDGVFPWLWHGFLYASNMTVATLTPTDMVYQRLAIDSKAMRKVKETEVMAMVFEVCESDDVGGNCFVGGGLRVLTGD